jgi:hypothetical protein
MTTALAHWTRRLCSAPQSRAHEAAAGVIPAGIPAVIPVVGPLPPMIVPTSPRPLDSRAHD